LVEHLTRSESVISKQTRLMQYGAAVLFPSLLSACNLEVNVNLTDSEGEKSDRVTIVASEAAPAPTVAPVAPAGPIAPTPGSSTEPMAPRAPDAPWVRPRPNPPTEPVLADVDVAIRDALWRPERYPTPAASPPNSEDVCRAPMFTPFTEAPSIRNRGDVLEAMVEAYPPELHEMGVGGTAYLYFCVDNDGRVMNVLLDKSSGNPALDEAALEVADIYRFTSAKKQGVDVPVWVSFPVTFQIR
jgi:periplasmic protein TonB